MFTSRLAWHSSGGGFDAQYTYATRTSTDSYRTLLRVKRFNTARRCQRVVCSQECFVEPRPGELPNRALIRSSPIDVPDARKVDKQSPPNAPCFGSKLPSQAKRSSLALQPSICFQGCYQVLAESSHSIAIYLRPDALAMAVRMC